jgi:hypothetical protein
VPDRGVGEPQALGRHPRGGERVFMAVPDA